MAEVSLIIVISSIIPSHRACRVEEAEVEKVGNDFVLKSDRNVRVSARAHKMSKSRGNVVNPDAVVASHGADSLRLYEMFMGPLRDAKVRRPRLPVWSDDRLLTRAACFI